MAKQATKTNESVAVENANAIFADGDMLLDVTVAGRTTQVRLGNLPFVAIEKVLRYGMQRLVNDKCGGSDRTDEEKHKLADEIVARLKAGEVGRAPGAPKADAVTAEARKLIFKALPEAARKKLTVAADDPNRGELVKARNAKLDALLEKNPAYREKAAAIVAERTASAESVDMSGVDL